MSYISHPFRANKCLEFSLYWDFLIYVIFACFLVIFFFDDAYNSLIIFGEKWVYGNMDNLLHTEITLHLFFRLTFFVITRVFMQI